MVNYSVNSVNRKNNCGVIRPSHRVSGTERFLLYLAAAVALIISRRTVETAKAVAVILGFGLFLGMIGGIECDVIPFFVGAPVCLGIIGSAVYLFRRK